MRLTNYYVETEYYNENTGTADIIDYFNDLFDHFAYLGDELHIESPLDSHTLTLAVF